MIIGSTIDCYMLITCNENISLAICRLDGKKNPTCYTIRRWEDDDENASSDLDQGMLRFVSIPIYKRGLIFISALIWQGRDVAWKVRLIYWIKKGRPREQQPETLVISYAMRGDYTLEPLANGIHHRSFRLVELTEAPLAKYVGKDRPHGTGLINL